MLSIGELAAQSGVAVTAIRYYEELGLIAAAQEAGFQRVEIASLLDGAPRRELVEEKLVEVRARIRRLQRVEKALEQAAECGCSSLDHCPIVVRRPVRRGS